MKKIMFVAVLILSLLSLTGCNYQALDMNYSYDYAIIMRWDGEQKIPLKSWRDYEDGEQIQLTAKDGTVYLVSSTYTILVKEP